MIGRRRDASRGQALAEFAIAAPVVFLVLLGLLDAGRLVFINNELSEAVREGARWGAVQGRAAAEAVGDSTGVTDEVKARIVVSPTVTVTLTCTDMGGIGGACGSGDMLTVNATATVSAITPIISEIIGPLTVTSQADMTIH